MNNKTLFNPSRLTLARKRRGLNMARLAVEVGIDPRSISAYEKGEFSPEDDKLREISRVLHFPIDFFFGDDLEQPTPDSVSFRALSRMTASQRDTALGAGAIALSLNKWIETRFNLPSVELPDLGQAENPAAAAYALRHHWELGEMPIKNMVHLLEAKGVRVFSLAIDAYEIDAFSMWHGSKPFVFLETKKSAEHSRFDAAHELGHLVLHRHGAPQGQSAEREANAFASAFLMPQASVLANVRNSLITVDQLIKLKKYWTVSVAALAYRLHSLGILTDWHYRRLFIEIGSRGYRKREPEEAKRETSQVFAKVFKLLRSENVLKKDIASALCVPAVEIEQLVFGLALIESTTGGESPRSNSQRPQLRILSKDD